MSSFFSDVDDSSMDELFESCGLEISSEPNLLVDSCYLFLKNLEDKLTLNDQLSEVVENEFKRICRDEEEKLVLLLSPVESNDASNDSVVQLMLGSRHLQYPAMMTLLELLGKSLGKQILVFINFVESSIGVNV